MTSRLEKQLQILIMVLTLILGTSGSHYLSDNSIYPITVVAGPFAAGFLFVLLTRYTSRSDTCSLTLSVVGTIGMGVVGMILSNILDDAQPYAWMVKCSDLLWGPLGDSVFVLMTLILFIAVPLLCFIGGRELAERFAVKQSV